MLHRPVAFVVSCEHARNAVPPWLRILFRGRARLLAGHRGHDRGALAYARLLARALEAPLFAGAVTRLVVDLNRSVHHPALFSALTRALPRDRRREILRRHYLPYRKAVEDAVADAVGRGAWVCHLSCHSFTPVRNGAPRNADVALLYDPARPRERALCAALHTTLAATGLRARRNYPFRGVADGLTSHLRRRFEAAAYAGIEIEVSQSLIRPGWPQRRRELVRMLAETTQRFVRDPAAPPANPAGSCPAARG